MPLIRPAQPTDAEAIVSINVRGRKDGYQEIIDQTYLDSRSITPEKIEKSAEWIKNAEILLVYEEDWRVLGFISGENARDENPPTERELSSFYVDPDYQRQGIWLQLFNAFKQAIGNISFYLWTLPWCKGEHFYEKHDWTCFGEKETEVGGKAYTEIWFLFS